MAFLRARQRVITGLTPHQGNRRFIIPKRLKQQVQRIPGTSLFFDFATDESLTDQVAGLTMDFARSTPAWDYDATGTLVEFAINTPRFARRLGDALPLGLGIAPASTNDLLASQDIEQAAWVASGGAIKSSPTRVQFGAFDTALLVQSTGAIHGIGANVTYTFGVTLNHDNGVADGTISILLQDGTNAAGEVEQVIAIAETKARQYVTITIPVTTADFITVTMLRRSGDTGAPINVVDWQLEALVAPTAPILTTVAPVTRAAENCDSADVTWYNDAAGTQYTKQMRQGSENNTGVAVVLADGSNYWEKRAASNLRSSSEIRTTANGSAFTSSANSGFTPFIIHKDAVAATAGDTDLYTDGAQAPTKVVPIAMPTVMTQLRLGRGPASGAFLNGYLLQYGYNINRLPNNILQAITQ